MKRTQQLFVRGAQAVKSSTGSGMSTLEASLEPHPQPRLRRRRIPRLIRRRSSLVVVLLCFISLNLYRHAGRRYDRSGKARDARSLLISFATSVYWGEPDGWDIDIFCPTPYGGLNAKFTSHEPQNQPADALIYYGPDLADLIRNQKFHVGSLRNDRFGSRVVNVYYSEEPPFASLVNDNQALEMSRLMNSFHVYAGFHPGQFLSSDHRICYHGWGLSYWKRNAEKHRDFSTPWSTYWHDPVPFEERKSDYHAVWVQRACLAPDKALGNTGPSPRVEIVAALMKRLRVASLGDCLHNAEFPEAMRNGSGFRNKFSAAQDDYLRQFKFAFVFENNLCDFYMSEKIWKAYALSVVPVVLGSRLIMKVLPSDDSYINVRDFSHVNQLSEYIEKVSNDEALFNSFFDWRSRPLTSLSRGFQNLWSTVVPNNQNSLSTPMELLQCCIARGVAQALRSDESSPVFPGLTCDDHDWTSFTLE